MTSSEKMSKGISLFAEGFGEAITNMVDTLKKALVDVMPIINDSLDYKFTKKKFKKMLQSYGKQRNEINAIMKNIKAPYTMKKLTYYISKR